MRPALIGLAALTAVGGTAIVVSQDPAPPETPPIVDLPAGIAPFIDKKVVPYEIEGKTAEELYAAIKEKGPRKGLARFWAYTEWAVDWHYRFKVAEGACAIDLESLAVRATYRPVSAALERLCGGCRAAQIELRSVPRRAQCP